MIKFNLLKTYKVNYRVFNSKLWHIEHKKCKRIDTIFYRNIAPNLVTGKVIRYNSIDRFINIEDIETQLHMENDNTISNMIAKRKSKYLAQLTDQEKEVLQNLDGVF